MLLIVITLGLLNLFFGEIVPAGGGFGWDGVTYANLTRNLDSIISEGQLNSYYAQRILPSTIVRGALIISGASFSDANIILGFQWYNLVILIGACLIWKRIADHFTISLGGRWIGFCGLFLSYQCSKQAFYYPVLTDVTALFLGLLLLLFYIEKRLVALFFTTIIGAFAWQVVSICGALLLLFMKAELPAEVIAPAKLTYSIDSVKLSRLIKFGWVVLLILSIVGVICCFRFSTVLDITRLENVIAKHGVSWLVETLANRLGSLLTGLPSLIGVTIALAMLVGSAKFFQAVLKNIGKTPHVLFVLASLAVLIPWGIVQIISNPSIPNPSSMMAVLRILLLPPSGKFLLPLVTLVSFWGPVVLLLLLNWDKFCIEARKLGPGFVALVGLSLPLGLTNEPRFITLAWPFLVLGIVLATEEFNKVSSFKYRFAILTILYAQFWMKINLAPWSPNDYEDLLVFPKQVLFMHYGLWMNWWSYLLQLFAIFLSILWLRKTLFLANSHVVQ